jgi:hypothetical protein
MLLQVLEREPSSCRAHHDHDAQLQSAGHDPTRPIVIDSDNESDVGSTIRHQSQARKRTLPSQNDQIKSTTRRNTRRSRGPTGSSPSQCQTSPGVFYPDLPTMIPRAGRGIIDDTNTAPSQEHLDRQLAQRLQDEEYLQILPKPAPVQVTTKLGREKEHRHSSIQKLPLGLAPDNSGSRNRRHGNIAQSISYATWAQPEVSVATRLCDVCADRHPVTELPFLAECKHQPQTCSSCYTKWIARQLESNGWRGARCPESECNIKLTYNEIRQNTSNGVFQQYDRFITRTALNEDCTFRDPAICAR